MDPVSLKRNDFPAPMSFGPDKFPRLWLDGLQGVEIPEEGEIRFRFSRLAKIEKEDRAGESLSVELSLKTITDICDCKGKDAENNESEYDEEMDAEDAMESLMEDLEDEDMIDESEDDNPDKY
jgi:hypothetical protein